jgi:hypothetical protein
MEPTFNGEIMSQTPHHKIIISIQIHDEKKPILILLEDDLVQLDITYQVVENGKVWCMCICRIKG